MGLLTTGTRVHFQRLYDLPERVLPPEVLAAPAPSPEDGGAAARRAGRHGPRRGHRARPARLLPAGARGEQAGGRRARGGGGAGADRRAGLARARLPRARRADAPADHGAGAAVPVRPVDLGARPHRAGLRLPLPHRDLHAGAEAGVRLLRVPVPARRRAGGPGRPEGRPGGGCAAGAGRVRRARGRPCAGGGRARRRAGRRWREWLGLSGVFVADRGGHVPPPLAARHPLYWRPRSPAVRRARSRG